MATKIGLGEITDINLTNFGMLTGGAKPGSPTYENALARLVEKGGDDLKGVTDPIERISSSVSRFIEENGMTETMQAEHTRMTEALKDGRELSPFNREMHRSRDIGLTMREASLAAPPVSAAPTTSAPTARSSVSVVSEPPTPAAPTASATSKMKPNFKYYNDPNYNPDIFFGDNEHTVRAFHPDTGEQMGRLSFYGKDAITPGEIDKIEVTEKFRRQGVATGLLEEARRISAVDENVPYVVHSKSRTPDGDAWAKSTGDALPEKIGSSDDLIEPSVVRSAVATETYDHGAGVSKSTASGETLSESPPPKSTRRGPGDIGKPADDIRTRPSSRGADAASTTTTTPKPPPTTGSVAMDPPKVTTAPPSSGAPSKAKTLLDDAAEAARNVARGHGNAKALGIAGAAALLGVGYASTKSKKSVNREDGTYMDQSRRDLGY
jgi:hypothetical protein